MHHHPHAVPDRPLVDVERPLVQVDLLVAARHADTEPGHRAGDLLQVPGEVLAAHADLGLDHPLDAEIADLGGPILLVNDLLWLAGVPTVDLPYAERRELLDGIGIAGPRWQVPPYLPDLGSARKAAADVGATGIVAKKQAAGYGEDWVALPAAHG